MCESTSVLQRRGEGKRREGEAVSSLAVSSPQENKLQFRPNEGNKETSSANKRRRQTEGPSPLRSDGFVRAAEFHATGHPLPPPSPFPGCIDYGPVI